MAEFIKVATRSELPDRCARCVEVKGRRIGLVSLDGEVLAFDDTCTHAEASLCEGDLDGDEIVCPLHFASFNVRTGECTGPPAVEDLMTYRVRIEGDDIEVEV
ncbi:MAG: non-heme iron oxygenase ferredoxin subunit [Planctomycetota bacterium]|jgi:nitrite reductase/ring-hydroxylating ferredoxin subunit